MLRRGLWGRASGSLVVGVALAALGGQVALAKDPGAGSVPETPGRVAVVDAMNGVTAAVQRCGGGWSGLVQTRFVFVGQSGAAASATVQSASVPSAIARCVESAAIAARVPPFRRQSFTVSYPFRIP